MQETNDLLKKSVFLIFWVGCVKDMHDFLLPSLRFTSTLHWRHLQRLAHPFNFKVSLKMCSFLEELQKDQQYEAQVLEATAHRLF